MGLEFTRSRDPAVAARPFLDIAGLRHAGLAVSIFLWLAILLVSRDRSLLHLWVGVPLFVYGAYLLGARRLPGPTPMDAWSAALAVTAAVSVVLAVDPRISAETALSRAAAVVAFYLVFDARWLRTLLIFRCFMLLGLLISVLALVSVALQYAEWLDVVRATTGRLRPDDLIPPTLPRTGAVLGHPNELAKLLNLVLPIAIATAIRPRTETDRWLSRATFATALLAMLFTLSRGGWLGTLTGLTVFAALLFWAHRRSPAIDARIEFIRTKARWFIAAGAVCAVAAAGFLVYALTVRPVWLFRDTVGTRFDAWDVSLKMSADHWLFGSGPASYFTLFDRYKGAISDIYPDAHNVYLTLFSEVGLAGSVVLLLGGTVLVRLLFEAWRTAGHNRLEVAAVLAALAATLAHGLASYTLTWSTVLIPVALLIAAVLREAPSATAPAEARGLALRIRPVALLAPASRVAVLALIPLTLAVWAYADHAEGEYQRSIGLTAMPDTLAASTAAAVEAANRDPGFWAFQMHAGVSSLQLYAEPAQPAERDGALLRQGIGYLERARRLAPDNALVNANLTLAYRLAGDRDASVAAARASISFDPLVPSVYAIAGNTFEWAGLDDEAVSAYAAAVGLDPSLAQSPYWRERPAALRAAVLVKAGIEPCELARYAALYAVYAEDLAALTTDCRQAALDTPSDANSLDLAIALAVLGRPAEAQAALEGVSGAGRRALGYRLAHAVLLADTSIVDARRELLRADRLGSVDARAMLLSAYALSDANEFGLRTPFTEASPGDLPDALVYLGWKVGKKAQSFSEISQRGPATNYYFFAVALRDVPRVILLPGDWDRLVPPSKLIAVLSLFEVLPELRDAAFVAQP
jgi:tetratricopeptide (TPR) repeat protein